MLSWLGVLGTLVVFINSYINQESVMEDRVRIIWQGGMIKGRVFVLERFDTTISGILQVLQDLGKHPNDFNAMIVDVRTSVSGKLPPFLFMQGSELGAVLWALRDKGLGKNVWPSY